MGEDKTIREQTQREARGRDTGSPESQRHGDEGGDGENTPIEPLPEDPGPDGPPPDADS